MFADVVLEPRLLNMLGTHRKKPWSIMEGGGTKGELSCSQEGFDLLDRMLCYDHQVNFIVNANCC